MYETLRVLLGKCPASGDFPTIGGDLNASISILPDGTNVFFSVCTFYPKASLAQTATWVILQEHHEHEGQNSSAQICFGRCGNSIGRRVWPGFRQKLAPVGGLASVVEMWCGFAQQGGCEEVMAARVANMDRTLPWHEILQIWEGYGLATRGA